jgi:hypothetical protein
LECEDCSGRSTCAFHIFEEEEEEEEEGPKVESRARMIMTF